ncbi:MAG: PEP-CTERM sorting domain-containing protein [Gemmatimonadaceae bacterium]
MRKILLAACSALAIGLMPAASAHAQVRVLTFEGIMNDTNVGSFYSGIDFSSNAYALLRTNLGGSGNFGGEPSAGTAAVFSDFPGEFAYFNVAAGFSNGFGTYYSAPGAPGAISIFSGLNGTGTLLATLMLPVTPFGSVAGCPPNPGASFCPFSFVGTSFTGVAQSVSFDSALNDFVFDDITIGSAEAISTVPEPSTFLLIGVGMLAVVGIKSQRGGKRSRKTQAE